MRYLDVCSGYSAATLAFRGFGWDCAGYAEIDPFASGVLAQRWGATAPMRMPSPDAAGLDGKDRKARHAAIKSLSQYHWDDRIPNFGDFTTIGADDVGPVDLLIGGTPCQSFSQAGLRLGLDDPRGNLTLEFLALAKRVRPRWLVWENVPGFLSHDGGSTAGAFFWLLGQLGYGWAYRILDAQFIRVDGAERAVPQRRRRIFVVGCLGNPAAAAAVLFDPESMRGDPQPRRRAGEATAGSLKASAGKRGGVNEAECGSLVTARMLAFGEYEEDGLASTVKARDHKDATDLIYGPAVAAPLTASRQSSDDGARTYIPFDTTQITNPHNPSNPREGDPCHALAADQHPPCIAFPEYMSGTACVAGIEDVSLTLGATNPTAIAFSSKDAGQDASHGISPTLRSMNHDASHANGGGQVAVVLPEPFSFQSRIARNGRGQPDTVAPALNGVNAGDTSDMRPLVGQADADGWAVRRLTPVECERLQGVPDSFTHIEMKKRQRTHVPADLEAYWLAQRPTLSYQQLQHLCADSPRYRVCGNSFASNVPRWIGHGIRMVEEILRERGL